MRPVWLLVLTLVASPAVAETLDGLGWLAGSWRGESGGMTMEEHWVAPDGGMMLAVSRVIVDEKVVGFEFLRIEARADGIVYVAQPNGRPGVEFRLVESTERSATFANPEHDHPKRLRYEKLSDGSLAVRIEGDEGVSELSFRPSR